VTLERIQLFQTVVRIPGRATQQFDLSHANGPGALSSQWPWFNLARQRLVVADDRNACANENAVDKGSFAKKKEFRRSEKWNDNAFLIALGYRLFSPLRTWIRSYLSSSRLFTLVWQKSYLQRFLSCALLFLPHV